MAFSTSLSVYSRGPLAPSVCRSRSTTRWFAQAEKNGVVKVVGISGSLRRASANSGILRVVQEVVPEGVEFVVADISQLPLFNQDLEDSGQPESVAKFKEIVLSADALLIATPEYNYSIPAPLKNAIDWASRKPNCFDDKPCTIISSGGGGGGMYCEQHIRGSCVWLNMHVLNKPALRIKLFDGSMEWDRETGDIKDEKTRERIKNQLLALLDWAERINGSRKLT